jgi:hypothetical protein
MQGIKGAAVVNYCKPLITQQMEASGPPLFQKGEK